MARQTDFRFGLFAFAAGWTGLNFHFMQKTNKHTKKKKMTTEKISCNLF